MHLRAAAVMPERFTGCPGAFRGGAVAAKAVLTTNRAGFKFNKVNNVFPAPHPTSNTLRPTSPWCGGGGALGMNRRGYELRSSGVCTRAHAQHHHWVRRKAVWSNQMKL